MDEVELLDEKASRKLLGGISRTSLWRHVKAGLLPKPITVGLRSKRWIGPELRQAILDAADRRGAA